MVILAVLVILPKEVKANDRDIIVILDPGHGGGESGAVAGGIVEKDVTWKIARKVKEILDNTAGITGILTRRENENPSLYDRGLLAKNSGADLLVSFHINASTNTSAGGAEVYITGNTNSPRFHQHSSQLGESILANLRGVGVPTRVYRPILRFSTDGELYSDGFLSDYYGIIRNPMYYGIPGVLIEHCYITNPNDRANFLNDWKINQMAEADAKAIIANKELFRINKENNFSNSTINHLEINNNQTHLVGEAIIVDWVNGMQTVPLGTPSIKLKATDGSLTIQCYATQVHGNKYYFDTHLAGLDETKEYRIEITTKDTTNIPTHPTSRPSLGNNRVLGENAENNYCIENSNLVIQTKEYVGDVTSDIQTLKVEKNINGNYYVTGEIVAIEWVNGQSKVPRRIPTIKLKATDGTITRNCYVKQIRGNTYYFDQIINGIDINKQYIMEIASENPFNLSTNKKQTVNLSKINQTIGKYEDKKVKIEDNKIGFEPYTYIGDLNTELYQFNKGQSDGASYVSGEIVVVEWVDGKSTVPTKTPKMRFISTDGVVNMEVFVKATGTNTYYFDRYIEGIDTNKEYQFIVESADSTNISQYNKVPVYFKGKFANKEIGEYQDLKIKLKNNKITFTDGTYIGDLNTELYQFNKGESDGASYISGEIVVVEWVEGQSTVPTKTPKMRFISTDGVVNMEVFVTPTGTNTYYFDRYIEGIDTTKEYQFIVESTDSNNISQYNKVPVYFKGQFADSVIGRYKDTQIKLINNKITFQKVTQPINEVIEERKIKQDKDTTISETIEVETIEKTETSEIESKDEKTLTQQEE